MPNHRIRFSIRDLVEITICAAVSSWVLSWQQWSAGEVVELISLFLLASLVTWLFVQGKNGSRGTGLISIVFCGGLFTTLHGPAIATRLWPRLLDACDSLCTPLLSLNYGESFLILFCLWSVGGLVSAGAYCATSYSIARTANLLSSKAEPAPATEEKKTSPGLLSFQYTCLLLVVLTYVYRVPVLSPVASVKIQNPMRGNWGFTADGRFLAELLSSGDVRLTSIDDINNIQINHVSCYKDLSEREDLHWAELVRRIWFLPDGRSLFLDSPPHSLLIIDTQTWEERPPRWNLQDGLQEQEIRGISQDGSIVVTSTSHPPYKLQNDVAVNVWRMPARKRIHVIEVSPVDGIWVSDQVIKVSNSGNLIIWQVRHGTRPGGRIESWSLNTGKRTPFLADLDFPRAVSIDDRYIACGGSVIDLQSMERSYLRGTAVCFCGMGGLIAVGHDRNGRGLPVLRCALAAALEHRILVYDRSGKTIRAVSMKPSQPVHPFAYAFRTSTDSRYFGVRPGGDDDNEVLIYEPVH